MATCLLGWLAGGKAIAAFCLGLAALAGCRGAPYVNSHLETVNAEYRQLEDYVYSLEDDNSRLQQELEACRARLDPAGATAPPRTGPFRRPRPLPGESPDLAPPRLELGTPTDAPLLEIPSETPPRRSLLKRPEAEDFDLPLELEAPAVELPAPTVKEPPLAKPLSPEALPTPPADNKVTHLFLNPVLTGGSDLDGQPGDDGLSVVVEPRNSADQYLP
ncbi:MAG: hypothetical protein WD872_20650 [Pirellulaceae bacterium]